MLSRKNLTKNVATFWIMIFNKITFIIYEHFKCKFVLALEKGFVVCDFRWLEWTVSERNVRIQEKIEMLSVAYVKCWHEHYERLSFYVVSENSKPYHSFQAILILKKVWIFKPNNPKKANSILVNCDRNINKLLSSYEDINFNTNTWYIKKLVWCIFCIANYLLLIFVQNVTFLQL